MKNMRSHALNNTHNDESKVETQPKLIVKGHTDSRRMMYFLTQMRVWTLVLARMDINSNNFKGVLLPIQVPKQGLETVGISTDCNHVNFALGVSKETFRLHSSADPATSSKILRS